MSKFLLKFENTAEIGDTIKAYDFRPMKDMAERYVVGHVVEKGFHNGVACYTIECIKDTAFPEGHNRVGEQVLVPFQITFGEFDGRVTKCAFELVSDLVH